MKLKIILWGVLLLGLIGNVSGVTEVNYTFDDADGTYSSTHAEDLAGHHNATVSGAIHTGGYIGQSYKFDGVDDFINTSILTMPTEFTISFWFKRISGGNTMITAKWQGGLGSFRIQDNNNLITPVLVDVTGSAGSCNYNVPQTEWVHTAMTFNGTNATLFINGSSVCTTGLSNAFNTSAGAEVLIGAWDGGLLPFNGYVDEYFMLNTTMTPAQITSLYQGQLQNFTQGLYDCASVGVSTLTVNVYNESSGGDLNVNLEGYFNYTMNGTAVSQVYSFNTSTTNIKEICINTENDNATTDYQLYYVEGTTGFSYFGGDLFLNSTEKTLNLYVTDNTAQTTFNVKNKQDEPLQDVYITIEKFHVGTNTYKTTEVIKTDTLGVAVGNMVQNTGWYKISITYNGEVKLIDYPKLITATEYTYRIDTLGGDYYDNFDTYQGLDYNITFNNATKNFRLEYNDPSLSIQQVCLEVVRLNLSGNNNIGRSCLDTSSGTILIGIGALNYWNSSFMGTGKALFSNGEWHYLDSVTAEFLTQWTIYDSTDPGAGMYVTLLLVGSMALLGIWSPIASIVLLLVSLIGSVVMGLYYISLPIMISLIVMGGIVIWRVNK